ncbi:hypothetical protein R3X27_07490 [Tropicimonas sp. TH_r6]|uniref:hypothetical protein n=1 Tax=Tropicimonas sp. TH_r6 TaxID=3082085 RepID=UPI00295462E9|nr:hypothetical protein [Tropicimonas sp. TH_r6]MDV7142524.1 hypothetical protein [Tropicimonas sp. TH_r6]
MIRLIIWATLFGLGVYVGIEAHRLVLEERCRDNGGRIGARGLCLGVMENG